MVHTLHVSRLVRITALIGAAILTLAAGAILTVAEPAQATPPTGSVCPTSASIASPAVTDRGFLTYPNPSSSTSTTELVTCATPTSTGGTSSTYDYWLNFDQSVWQNGALDPFNGTDELHLDVTGTPAGAGWYVYVWDSNGTPSKLTQTAGPTSVNGRPYMAWNAYLLSSTTQPSSGCYTSHFVYQLTAQQKADVLAGYLTVFIEGFGPQSGTVLGTSYDDVITNVSIQTFSPVPSTQSSSSPSSSSPSSSVSLANTGGEISAPLALSLGTLALGSASLGGVMIARQRRGNTARKL